MDAAYVDTAFSRTTVYSFDSCNSLVCVIWCCYYYCCRRRRCVVATICNLFRRSWLRSCVIQVLSMWTAGLFDQGVRSIPFLLYIILGVMCACACLGAVGWQLHAWYYQLSFECSFPCITLFVVSSRFSCSFSVSVRVRIVSSVWTQLARPGQSFHHHSSGHAWSRWEVF